MCILYLCRLHITNLMFIFTFDDFKRLSLVRKLSTSYSVPLQHLQHVCNHFLNFSSSKVVFGTLLYSLEVPDYLVLFALQDAKNLWEKIQKRQGLHKWRPDLEEEYEDQEGNIYNKKTYADLQRQGLI